MFTFNICLSMAYIVSEAICTTSSNQVMCAVIISQLLACVEHISYHTFATRKQRGAALRCVTQRTASDLNEF